MIKITIDKRPFYRLFDKILVKLIHKRAYEGYVWYVKKENQIPWKYNDFKQKSTFNIFFCFQIYIERIKSHKELRWFYNRKDIIRNIWK